LFVCVVLSCSWCAAWADERSAAALLPTTTVLYAEMTQPSAVVELLREHPLRARVEALQGVKDAYATKQYLEFKAVVAVVEAQLGQTWPQVVKAAAAGGLSVGLDAETSGVAVLAKAQDEATWPRIVATLIELARADARGKGNPDPIKSGEHRGITAYQVGQAKLAAFGPWLLVTNNGDLGQKVLDNFLDQPEKSLETQEPFQQARHQTSRDGTAWGYVNVAHLRSSGAARQVFSGKTDNPLAELLVGGLLDNLRETPFVTAALKLGPREARLELTSPHQSEWVSEARHYYFGADSKGAAPPLLNVRDRMLAVSAYRNVSLMWLQAGELFEDKVVDQLAQADSNLATLFSGKDFGEEILGAVGPEVQIVVARQQFEEDAPRPAIKLPAFALTFRLKDPATMQPELRRTFQSLIGFLNVVGAMNAQPQLDLGFEKTDQAQLVTATYLPEKDPPAGGLKIHYNFSPSVAFVGDRFVVSSSQALARELAALLVADQPPALSSNAAARADVAPLSQILHDNLGQLVAQNMLQEGHTKEEAEREIGDLLTLLDSVRDAALVVDAESDRLRVSLELNFSNSTSTQP